MVGVTDEGNIIVATNSGNVEIAPPGDFDVSSLSPGDRIAAHMDKEALPIGGGPPQAQTDTPFTVATSESETDTPATVTGSSFRIGTALRIKVIPGKATGSHNRAVIVTQQGDTVNVVDEDGNEDNVGVTGDGGVQTSGDGDGSDPVIEQEQVEDGTDVVLLTQCAGPDATPLILSIQRADRIAQRLDRLQAKFEDNPEKAAKFADLKQKQLDRLQARLDKTSNNAPPSARGNVDKARGKGKSSQGDCPEDGDTNEDCPKDKGKPEDKGNPKDKDSGGKSGGPPEDKGKGKK